MNKQERLKEWASKLKQEQMENILVDLVDFAIDAEMVSFNDSALNPYWRNTGEPLIEGQPHLTMRINMIMNRQLSFMQRMDIFFILYVKAIRLSKRGVIRGCRYE